MEELKTSVMQDIQEKVSIRKTLPNGLTKETTIRKIENGYIICKNTYGSDADNGGKYIDETKEYYSKENPLKTKEENEDEHLGSLLNSIDRI